MHTYEVKLREIADVFVGYQSRGRIDEDMDSSHMIIRTQDFDDNGYLSLGGLMRFSPKINPARYLIKSGDILVRARGRKHSAHLIKQDIDNAVASNTFYVVRPMEQDNILPAYLSWWLNQPSVQTYFQRERSVSTIPFISKSVLRNTKIRIPPLETQVRINEVIRLWEKEEALTQQLAEKKEILIQEMCQRAIRENVETM